MCCPHIADSFSTQYVANSSKHTDTQTEPSPLPRSEVDCELMTSGYDALGCGCVPTHNYGLIVTKIVCICASPQPPPVLNRQIIVGTQRAPTISVLKWLIKILLHTDRCSPVINCYADTAQLLVLHELHCRWLVATCSNGTAALCASVRVCVCVCVCVCV